MAGRIRFVCLLHSHQPVGNFDHVIEEAYKLSYLPYVEVFEQFPEIPLTNHFSGCLLEWLEHHHPEYFEKLNRHTHPSQAAGKPWEMEGGGFYEPIMTMLPERDRVGQTVLMSNYIEKHFGVRPRGLWLPERVWEPALVKDLADAGVKYLTLDDTHFKAAGLDERELVGGFITEDQGRIIQVYPASEKLRYLVPFATVHDCLQWLRSIVPADGERIVCYADDGEKFGVWPKTFQHVYNDGWLKNFLGALQHAQNEGWLICSTLSDAYDEVEPVGQVYLPENSYREMTEWALPSRRLLSYEHAIHDIQHDQHLAQDERIKSVLALVKGGNWRSFKTKYPEGNRMYAKMMEVSAKVAALPPKARLGDKARTHLYRGQCNCPYWHGVFGGMYLPHLRSAVYSELIRADILADESRSSSDGKEHMVTSSVQDFDFDGALEAKLSNRHFGLYFHPGRGGHLYEFDLRDIAFNVGDTFSRRFEAYHDKVARAVVGDGGQTASIHDLIKAKQPGLAELLNYDTYLRESLVDHLSSSALTVQNMLSGNPPSEPGFRQGDYELCLPRLKESGNAKKLDASLKKGGQGGTTVIDLIRRASWYGTELQITKHVVLGNKNSFEVEYTLEHCGGDEVEGFFGVEMNYSLLAGDAHDRYYYHERSENAGKLATAADFGMLSAIGLKDHWLNVALTLHSSQPANVVVSPVKTVSQSEGGFEAVYQSSCVLLQWPIKLKPAPRHGKGSGGQTFTVKLRQEYGRARA